MNEQLLLELTWQSVNESDVDAIKNLLTASGNVYWVAVLLYVVAHRCWRCLVNVRLSLAEPSSTKYGVLPSSLAVDGSGNYRGKGDRA